MCSLNSRETHRSQANEQIHLSDFRMSSDTTRSAAEASHSEDAEASHTDANVSRSDVADPSIKVRHVQDSLCTAIILISVGPWVVMINDMHYS